MFNGLNELNEVRDLDKNVQHNDFIKFQRVKSSLKNCKMAKKWLLKGSIITLTNTELKNIGKVTRSLGIIAFLKKRSLHKN